MKKLSIQTTKQKEVIDFTDQINELIKKSSVKEGICFINILHTTTALSVADLDPGTDLDMLDAFEALIPKLDYRHPHNPEHVPDHILSAMIGTSLTLPIEEGKLVLGTWQRVVLFEFDGPRERGIVLNFK